MAYGMPASPAMSSYGGQGTVQANLPGGQSVNLVDAGNGLFQEPGKTGPGFPYYRTYNAGNGVMGASVAPSPQQAAPTAAAAAQPAQSYFNPGASNANTGYSGTPNYVFQNGTSMPASQLAPVASLYQSYLQGNQQAGASANQWAQAMGLNPQQLANLASTVQGLNSGQFQSVQGANNQTLYRSPNGQYFSIDPQTGQRTAATQTQLSSGQYPTIAGYDAQGNPYYQPYQAPSQASLNLQTAQQNAVTPEAAAFESVKATDPGLAQAVQQLQSYYNTSLTNASTPQNLSNAMQSYQQIMDKIDPASAQLRGTMAQSYMGDVNAANAGQLPTGVANEVAQSARAAQTARGNALGTSQAAQEAMSTGLTGLQVRQQALQNAQSWLSSGLTTGQQTQQSYQYGQGAGNTAAGNTLSYLGSGQTPYGLGTGQLANIQNQATSSNQQTQYQPTYSGGPNYSYINPNAGSEFAQGANSFFNSQVNQNLGTAGIATQQQGNLYGLIGSIAEAAGNAIGGAAKMCWVAREVFGEGDEWKQFRNWLATSAPHNLFQHYVIHGEKIAEDIRGLPETKELIKLLMQQVMPLEKNH